jgi:hypothetical protein
VAEVGAHPRHLQDAHPLRAHPAERAADRLRLCRAGFRLRPGQSRGLSFLGLGVQPGTSDWGRMLFENRNILLSNPVALLLPALMIILTAGSINLIGDWVYEQFSAQ